MFRPLIIGATAFAATLSVLALSGTEGERGQAAARSLGPRAEAPRYAGLATTHLRRARETGDPGYYTRAEQAAAEALRLDPAGVDGLVASAALALSRHDFPRALRLARRARRAAPQVLRSYPVLVDALVENGRPGDAARALQRLLDRKPGYAAYARASYLRELRGDLDGAAAAMRFAVSAGGETPEEAATLRALLGDVELLRGRRRTATRLYGEALARFPGHAGATLGLARVSPTAKRLRLLEDLVARLPLPEHAIALGESQLAAGQNRDAAETFALVDVERRLLERAGVRTDELAAFVVDRGRPREGLRMARRGPRNARALDAEGWALTRLGRPRAGLRAARRALALDAGDPGFRYHAGVAALRAGRRAEGRRLLRTSLRSPERLGPLYAAAARRELRR